MYTSVERHVSYGVVLDVIAVLYAPASFPTPIWFPTEYIESRLERARIAK